MIEKALVLFIFIIGISGCGYEQEAANKSEYSVVQGFEYKYRESDHDTDYKIFKNAMGGKEPVILLPIKGQATGYVVILARSEAPPLVKTLPQNINFTLTRDTLLRIKSEISISKEVEQFLVSHLQ